MAARLRDVSRALKSFNVEIEPGSKHYKATRAGARCYTIPAHNGEKTDVVDHYIRGVCRNFGIDEDEFRKLL